MGAGVWTPENMGDSLLAWWDPTTGITKNSGTNRTSAWVDRKSGIEYAQATGGAQPLWTSDGINERPALYFDGVRSMAKTYGVNSEELLQLTQTASAGWFGIVKPDVAGASDTLLAVPPGTTTTLWLKLNDATQDYVSVYRTSTTGHFFTPTIPPSTAPVLLGGTIEAGMLYGHADDYKSAGAAVGVATPAAVGFDFTLGQRRAATVDADNLAGYVGDVLVFRTAPTAYEKAQLVEWARTRWGY